MRENKLSEHMGKGDFFCKFEVSLLMVGAAGVLDIYHLL